MERFWFSRGREKLRLEGAVLKRRRVFVSTLLGAVTLLAASALFFRGPEVPLGLTGAELIYSRTLPVSENSSNSMFVYAVPHPFQEVSKTLQASSNKWPDFDMSDYAADLAHARRMNGYTIIVQPGRLVREIETVDSETVVNRYGNGRGYCMLTVSMSSSRWRSKFGSFIERFRGKARLYQYQIIRDGDSNPISFEHP